VFYDEEGNPVTEEQMRENARQSAMAHDAFGRDLRRMLFDELDEDQMGTLQHLFRILGATQNKEGLVNWYEGLIDGACHARRRARELESSPTPTRECHPFQADGEDPDTFWACVTEFGGLICGRERDHQVHLSWDAGDGLGK